MPMHKTRPVGGHRLVMSLSSIAFVHVFVCIFLCVFLCVIVGDTYVLLVYRLRCKKKTKLGNSLQNLKRLQASFVTKSFAILDCTSIAQELLWIIINHVISFFYQYLFCLDPRFADYVFIAQFRHLSPAAHYDSQVVNHETDPDTPLKSVDGHTFSKTGR